jgi:site-specific DNA recombinase
MSETKSTRAAGYVRVSTEEQVREGWNLDEDKQRIRELVIAEGWELFELWNDGGLKGDDPDRPGLRAMLDSLDKFDVLVMRSLDRLSRDLFIYAQVRNALRDAGVHVWDFNGPMEFDLTTNIRAVIAEEEKAMIGRRVRQARQARARAGLVPGGHAFYGYTWREGELVVVLTDAAVVRRIFTEYVNGMGQRSIVRALNADHVLTREGRTWQQSAITRILNRIAYTGKLSIKGADGEPQVLDGKHEAIIDGELWERAQAIKAGASRRKGGRQADGGHLLVRGLLRCPRCGSTMIPRKARRGIERERYVCSGRIADPSSCDQPSIRRELIDKPFLATVLDSYIDFEVTRSRIEDRAASVLTAAREALAHAEAEVSQIDRALATTERDYDAGDITGKQYSGRQERLTNEREAALAAVDRAQAHVEQVGQGSVPDDAEQLMLDHLAALKQAVSSGVGAAPNLAVMRNVIGDLFEAVHLVRSGEGVVEVARRMGEGFIPWHDSVPTLADGKQGYWLLLELRASAVDAETLRPMGQAMPVLWFGQYPPGFLCKYCWW